MITLNLSFEEQETLINVLDNCIEDLREEIQHTDRLEFKTILRHRRDVLHHLLMELQTTREAQPA